MKTSLCSLIIASAVVLSACGSKGSAQNGETAAAKAPAEAAPPPKPVVSCVPAKVRVEAPPARSTTKTPTKTPAKAPAKNSTKAPASTTTTAAKAAPAPTAPTSPNADGTCPAGYDRIVTQPEPEPAPAASSKDDGSPRMVKSRDGSYEGEVYGRPAAGSKLAKLQIGMPQPEVEKLIGRPDDIRGHITGKAFNPFYFGSDAARVEWIYRGYGSVAFDAGHWGGGGGVVMMINHDPKIQ